MARICQGSCHSDTTLMKEVVKKPGLRRNTWLVHALGCSASFWITFDKAALQTRTRQTLTAANLSRIKAASAVGSEPLEPFETQHPESRADYKYQPIINKSFQELVQWMARACTAVCT